MIHILMEIISFETSLKKKERFCASEVQMSGLYDYRQYFEIPAKTFIVKSNNIYRVEAKKKSELGTLF